MDSGPDHTEMLLRQMADMDQLIRHFGALRARLAALTESAAYDPEAQMRLARLQQVWDGGVGQQFEELRAQMKAMMRNGTESLERTDDTADKRQISMTSCRPLNKAMRKKIRCLG